ncbi:hypothetical protein CSC12_1854 [Klebsiella michiganensis]|nr:hypothetical protein CSC12_1854 [Klebsiella michiganensis]
MPQKLTPDLFNVLFFNVYMFYLLEYIKHSPHKLNKSRRGYNSFLVFIVKVNVLVDMHQTVSRRR